MKKLGVFIIILSVVFMSCNRKTTLKGRVMNPITGEGIAGATISASKTTMELPGGYKTVEQTTSDANGDFILEFKKSASNIGVSTGDYYNIGWYQNGEIQPGYYLPVQQGKNMKADFYAVPYGSSKANIVNINCQGVTDTAYFKLKYILSPSLYDYWSPPRVGCYSHSDATAAKRPMGKYVWITKVIRSGNTSYQYDTVFVNESGVSVFNINY